MGEEYIFRRNGSVWYLCNIVEYIIVMKALMVVMYGSIKYVI